MSKRDPFYVVTHYHHLKKEMESWVSMLEVRIVDDLTESLFKQCQSEQVTRVLYIMKDRHSDTILHDLNQLSSLQKKGGLVAILTERDEINHAPDLLRKRIRELKIPLLYNGETLSEIFRDVFSLQVECVGDRKPRICVFSPHGGVGKSMIAAYLAYAISKKERVRLWEWNPFSPTLKRYFSIKTETEKGFNSLMKDIRKNSINHNGFDHYAYESGNLQLMPATLDLLDIEHWEWDHLKMIWEWLDQHKEDTVINDIPLYPQFASAWPPLLGATDIIIPVSPQNEQLEHAAIFIRWLKTAQITKSHVHVIVNMRSCHDEISLSAHEKILGHPVSAVLPDAGKVAKIDLISVSLRTALNEFILNAFGIQAEDQHNKGRRSLFPLRKTG